MNEQNTIQLLAKELGERLQAKGWRVTTAESCTGGGVASAITEIAGSSEWFDMALVTYANAAKQQLVGVQPQTLAEFGAVSEPVVVEMAAGALAVANADIAVAISGIAGPDGGSDEKPVGTVWFAWASRTGEQKTCLRHFDGDRHAVRYQAVITALDGLNKQLK